MVESLVVGFKKANFEFQTLNYSGCMDVNRKADRRYSSTSTKVYPFGQAIWKAHTMKGEQKRLVDPFV
jgi:hypothetical protein